MQIEVMFTNGHTLTSDILCEDTPGLQEERMLARAGLSLAEAKEMMLDHIEKVGSSLSTFSLYADGHKHCLNVNHILYIKVIEEN